MGNGGLTSLDVKIDGLDFTLNNSSEVTYFYQGTNLILSSLGFSGTIGVDRLLSISFGGLGGYSFTDYASVGFAYDTFGSVSISPAVSADAAADHASTACDRAWCARFARLVEEAKDGSISTRNLWTNRDARCCIVAAGGYRVTAGTRSTLRGR